MIKKTRLFDLHVRQGGKMIDFFGWHLPVQFKGIISEHEAVRTKAGLFDVSHMGEFFVTGSDALSFLQHVLTNNIKKMTDYQCLYSPMCRDNGCTIDDMLIYRFSADRYMMVPNAANLEKDFAWLKEHQTGNISLVNASDDYAQLALQGPEAEVVLSEFMNYDFSNLLPNRFCCPNYQGDELIVSRTGYTGEDGFEIYFPQQKGVVEFAEGLLAHPSVSPTGLGARDTLRFEAKMPLYGHELSEVITPVEAGLKFFCDIDGEPFIGQASLKRQVDDKPSRRLIGLEMKDRSAPKTAYEVFEHADGPCVGFVTSGSFCPSVNKTHALALVNRGVGKVGAELLVDVRGKKKPAVVVKTPFYTRTKTDV